MLLRFCWAYNFYRFLLRLSLCRFSFILICVLTLLSEVCLPCAETTLTERMSVEASAVVQQTKATLLRHHHCLLTGRSKKKIKMGGRSKEREGRDLCSEAYFILVSRPFSPSCQWSLTLVLLFANSFLLL